MKNNAIYLKSIRFPSYTKQLKKESGRCEACGEETTFQYFDVINDELAKQWEINESIKKAFSVRESMHCGKCRCSARLRALAKSLSIKFGERDKSLKENIEEGKFDKLSVAEINSCGELHDFLKNIKKLAYSEYGDRVKDVRREDLQRLTYKNESFDLVLTSDTLEHVPDYQAALREIHRVLKPGGYHIFTIPLIFSRLSRRRIKMEKNKVKNLLEPSFHGSGEEDNLVCIEFGIDFLHQLKEARFKTDIYFGSPFDKNEVNYVLVSKKLH